MAAPTQKLQRRQKHRRYFANFVVFHVGLNTSGNAYTRNISEGGAFIETKKICAPGTMLQLEIFLDLGNEIHSMHTDAEVMWCSEPGKKTMEGMGLRFISIDKNDEESLRLCIGRLSTRPSNRHG